MNDREYIQTNVIPVLHEIIQLDWDATDAVEVADKIYLDIERMYYNLMNHLNETEAVGAEK